MKPSTLYYGVSLAIAALMVGLLFEVGSEAVLRDHGTAFLAMVVCGATATILREMGR